MISEPNVVLVAPRTMNVRTLERPQQSHALVLGGSLIMLIGTGVVSVVNFGYQVTMARTLGPALFGDVSVVATLLMLASAITQSFQLVCAKFVARNQSHEGKTAVYGRLMKRAWMAGIAVAVVLVLARGAVTSLFRLNTPALIIFLAVAVSFSVPTGVKRGGLQGLCNFQSLNSNFVLEAVVKLVAALVLVGVGYGVYGAVGAMTISVVAAFIFTPVSFPQTLVSSACIPASFREGFQAILFSAGQVLINNVDILLVKYFFSPEDAGLYAAVALFGRLLYYSSWAIITAMFPVSAGVQPDEKTNRVLLTPLLLVLAMSVGFVLMLLVVPHFLITLVFGESFIRAGSLLALYATAAALYSLSVVLITYEMSRKIANTGWLQLVMGGVIVLSISVLHHSLRQVIVIQIVVMALLLATVSLPFLRKLTNPSRLAEIA